MHTTHTATACRRLAVVIPAGLILIAMAALAGCSGGGPAASAPVNGIAAGNVPDSASAAVPTAVASASAAPRLAGSGPGSGGGSAQSSSANRLAASGQQLIYIAQLTVRARSVGAAVARATAIATSAGGYVSAENATTDPGHPDRATATMELKIPVPVYPATLAQLSAGLGTQLSLQQQAQDVTQEVADVSSRVASDEAAIAQLRTLLQHAGSVGDLLTVQDQINNEESDLEELQAQQSALNHETSYATVSITVLGPTAVAKPAKPTPPPGFTSGITGGWRAFRTTLSWLLTVLGAVAPFAGIIGIPVALGYWLRRRTTRGARPGSAA